MKVYIVTKEGFPTGMAATNRIKCYARAIHEGGIDCEIIVRGATELRGKVYNKEAQGIYEGIPFRYIGGTTTDMRQEYIRRFAQLLRLRKTEAYLRRNLEKGDVLFLYRSESVNQMLRFARVAKKKNAYCVCDLCELPYGTGEETKSAIKNRKLTLDKLFPRMDGIVSISDTLLDLAKQYTTTDCKHIKVPIMVDFDDFFMQDESGKTDRPYIFHSGTLYDQKDGFSGMIEAFGMALKKLPKDIVFISTGNLDKIKENDRKKVQSIISQYNLTERVLFTGYITNEELKNYLCKARMVIINKYRTQQNKYCFSTKLGEYLAAAKTVIITNVGEAMNWLKNGESAYIVEPGDTDALADAIVQVLTHPEDSRKIGLAGQEVCRNCFDYRNWSKPLVEFLNILGKQEA